MLVSFAVAAGLAAAQGAPPPAAQPARLVRGTISEADYPPAARRTGAQGAVFVRYTVGADGAVSRCGIVSSSGSEELDAVSCAIVSRRFRFSPARGPDGRPVAETRTQRFLWRLPEPPPEAEDAVD